MSRRLLDHVIQLLLRHRNHRQLAHLRVADHCALFKELLLETGEELLLATALVEVDEHGHVGRLVAATATAVLMAAVLMTVIGLHLGLLLLALVELTTLALLLTVVHLVVHVAQLAAVRLTSAS